MLAIYATAKSVSKTPAKRWKSKNNSSPNHRTARRAENEMAIKRAQVNGDQITSFQRGDWQKFRTGQVLTADGKYLRVTINRDANGNLSFSRRHDVFAWCNPCFEHAQKHWGANTEAEAARMFWDALDFAEFGCVSSTN